VRHENTPVVPLWVAIALAVGAGPVMDFAFPDANVWVMIFPGLAMLLIALIGRSAPHAYLVGFLGGLSFYLVHIPWISKFLGDDFDAPLNLLPLVALSTFEAIFWGAGAVLIALAYRWIPVAFPGFFARVLLLPSIVAGLWVAREAVTSTWPWGGFSWGRLAFSQSESPFAALLPWIGAAGVSFVVAFLTASVIEAVRVSTRENAITAAVVVVASATVALAIPPFAVETDGTMRVAAVQGNGKAGYFGDREYGDLIRAQYDATAKVSADDNVDVVVWPEGGTDIDPLTEPTAARVFDDVATRLGAPLVSGAITERGDTVYNTSLLWQAGSGATDLYDKRHPVPFGEYVPAREFFEPLAPDLIGLIGREYTPGTTDAVFDIDGVLAGINICFDIVDDALMRETVDDGAQILFAQSNNADFGRTDESVQQLAIARVRALELGRSVVVISTVGTSAVITPDGASIDELEWFTSDVMIDDVPLSTVTTPATAFGRHIELFAALFSLVTLLGAAITSRGKRRG
jgi:apolipoprotein N-acyltransferase